MMTKEPITKVDAPALPNAKPPAEPELMIPVARAEERTVEGLGRIQLVALSLPQRMAAEAMRTRADMTDPSWQFVGLDYVLHHGVRKPPRTVEGEVFLDPVMTRQQWDAWGSKNFAIALDLVTAVNALYDPKDAAKN